MFDNPVAIFFLALNIFLAVWAFLKPWHGFLALLIITPFPDFLKRLSFLFSYPSSADWLLILGAPDLILLGIYLNYVFIMRKEKNFLFMLRTREGKAVLGFMIWVCLTLFWGQFPFLANLAAAKMILPYIPLFFVAPLLLNSAEKIRKVIQVIIVIGLISAVYGCYQFLFGMTTFERMWSDSSFTFLDRATYYSSEVFRSFSFFASPDTYSYYLVIALTLLPLLFGKGNPLQYLLSAILLAGIVTSLFRTAIILYGIIIFLMTLVNFKASYRHLPSFVNKYTLLCVMILSIIALNYFNDLFPDIATSQPAYADAFENRAMTTSTYYARIYGREMLWQNLNYKMLIGYGLCATQWGGPAANKFSAGEVYVGDIAMAHDLVSESIVSIGLIGFIFIAMIFYYFITSVIDYGKNIKDLFLRELCKRVWVMVLGFFIIGCLSGGAFIAFRPVIIIMWSIMGVCSCINAQGKIFSRT